MISHGVVALQYHVFSADIDGGARVFVEGESRASGAESQCEGKSGSFEECIHGESS